MKRFLSVVLPAYNEELGVGVTVKGIPLKKISRLGFKTEVIVVDNNSTDNTAQVARKLGARVLKEKKQGTGYAIRKGISASRGEIVLVCDADGTYPVGQIPKLISFFDENSLDFLNTNRFASSYLSLKVMPWLNRIGNFLLSLLFRLLFEPGLKDSQSGMFLFKRSLWPKLKIRSGRYAFIQEIKIELIFYQKCNWKEVNIGYNNRLGKSKLNKFYDGFENFGGLIKKRFQR